MELKERIRANPIWSVVSAAGSGFMVAVSLLLAIHAFTGMSLVLEGTHLTREQVEDRYLSREHVEQRYVARAEHTECEQDLRQVKSEAAQYSEKFSACELDLKAGGQQPTSTGNAADGSVVETSEPASPASNDKSTLMSDGPSFHSRWFQLEVASVEIGVTDIIVVVEVQPAIDEPVDFRLDPLDTRILDHRGHRWVAGEDTAGLFLFPSVELLPGTALRSRIRFSADDRSGEVPSPQPPFTLASIETNTGQRIVVQGLEPQN